MYVRPEDEFFAQHAPAGTATFAVTNRPVAKDELQPLRMALLLPAAKVPVARCVASVAWAGKGG